nr:hypothetical protein [Bradyrhizobium xenonodulans]
MVPEAGGFALCVWLFEGGLVCAWFEAGLAWLEGWLVCAWLVELFEVGACVVLVPELDVWPAALWPVDDGVCVWAEFVEGLVCADPEEELDDGVDVDEDGGVDVDPC